MFLIILIGTLSTEESSFFGFEIYVFLSWKSTKSY